MSSINAISDSTKTGKIFFDKNKNYSYLLNKWVSYGFEKEIFLKYPLFVEFMFSSKLASQMKITKDKVRVLNEQPHLLVEGIWLNFKDILNRFEFHFDKSFNESFLRDRTENLVYTYLDNGFGLERFHPYKEGLNKPISKIPSKKYLKLLLVALKFERPTISSRNKNHILQIVTSTVKINHSILRNFYKTFTKPKHPYIRLIDPYGNVYEMGFGLFSFMKKKIHPQKRGFFRSIDMWEYIQVKKRIVTNIAISEDEFKNAQSLVSGYIENKKRHSFSFLNQNCAVFTQHFIKEVLDLNIPVDMCIFNVIKKINPNFIKNLSQRIKLQKFKKIKNFVYTYFFIPFSPLISLIKKIIILAFLAIAQFVSFIVNICFYSFGGKKFSTKKKKLSIFKIKDKFNLKLVYPLQSWQKKQASTVIYHNPTKLKQTII